MKPNTMNPVECGIIHLLLTTARAAHIGNPEVDIAWATYSTHRTLALDGNLEQSLRESHNAQACEAAENLARAINKQHGNQSTITQ